jgi:hypothetical protein
VVGVVVAIVVGFVILSWGRAKARPIIHMYEEKS